jgi:hypothetical protein
MTRQAPVRYIPKGYELIAKDERFGFEVWGQLQPRVVAMAYGGKRSKPDWYYRFADEKRLHQKIEETLRGYMQSAEMKAEWKAKRSAPHDVQVGDVFRASWGYDQTNIDYYQCTRVIGAMIEVREIGSDREETGFMQGQCVPMMNQFIGEPMRKKVSMAGGEPSFSVSSYANAHRIKPVADIGGAKVYGSSHWTSYA